MRSVQISAKIASHSSTAIGRATTKPRAKLPLPRRTESARVRKENLAGRFTECASVNITYCLPLLSHRVPQWKRFPSKVNARPSRITAAWDSAANAFRSVDREWLTSPFRQSVRCGGWRALRCTACAGMLLGSVFAQCARAQEADVGSPESLVEQAEPLGLRAGAIEIFPRLTADVRYDSNIYNRPSPELDDFAFVLRPSISVRPDLARHELRLDLAGEARRYFDTPAENSEQFLARLSARADLAERTTAQARVQVSRRIERRGTLGDEFLTDRPVSYLETEAAVGLARTGGRLELSGELSAAETAYDDARLEGVSVVQSFRDTRRLRGTVRAGYRLGTRFSPFVQLSANDLQYDLEPEGPRGSSGFAVLGGIRFDLGQLVEAEAAVGYMRQNFEDPLKADFGGIDFRLAARWTPIPRLQLAAEGRRSVERSPLPEAPAVVESSLRASALYAMGSRTLVGLELGSVSADYSGIDRSERRYFTEASLEYRINPRLAAFAGAGYRHQDGEGTAARSYGGSSFRLGVRWTP